MRAPAFILGLLAACLVAYMRLDQGVPEMCGGAVVTFLVVYLLAYALTSRKKPNA